MQPILKRLRQESKDLGEAKYLVVAIQLPTGAIEIITNTTDIETKVEYYLNTYDEEGNHKHAPCKMVGFMIG